VWVLALITEYNAQAQHRTLVPGLPLSTIFLQLSIQAHDLQKDVNEYKIFILIIYKMCLKNSNSKVYDAYIIVGIYGPSRKVPIITVRFY